MEVKVKKEGKTIDVTLENKSSAVAFFVRMDLKIDGEMFPAFWTDNLVTLQPGESRTLSCEVATDLEMSLTVSGWNVEEQMFSL